MVDIIEFDMTKGYVIFENPESNLKMTFNEWRHIAEVYYKWVGLPDAEKGATKARDEVRGMFGLPPMDKELKKDAR